MLMDEKSLVRESSMKLKKLRADLNWSYKAMANRMGVTRTTYWKHENGQAFPAYKSLKSLSDDFGLSMDWFIFNKGPKHLSDKGKDQEMESLKKEVEQLKQKLEQSQKELELEKEKTTGMEELEQELKDAGEEVTRLKEQEEERKRREEIKAEKEKAAVPPLYLKPEVKELLGHMEQIPVLFHEVMLHFHKFKFRSKEQVADAMLPDTLDFHAAGEQPGEGQE
ncbi:MAG: helix-turn-helix domain-containing protein [bacterium]|nr:helix-turn-helix domain-containing protein [bacterium]